jgi:hypothetical protein
MTDADMPTTKDTNEADAGELNGFFQRQAKRVARKPCTHFWVALLVSLGLSYVALVIGKFEVSVNSGGWQSRGTLIANRQTQLMLTQYNQDYLFSGGNEAWGELTNNVQRGWEDDDDTVEESSRRLGSAAAVSASNARDPDQAIVDRWIEYLQPQADRITVLTSHESTQRSVPFKMTPDLSRRLQDQQSSALEACDMEWYNSANVTEVRHLWPVWKTQTSALSALSPEVIRDICVAEQKTQKVLEENDLCFGCDQGCLPPMSLVLYARLLVPNGMSMTCQDLADAWAPYEETVKEQWTACIQEIKATYNQGNQELPESCPFGFSPVLVDDKFDETSVLVYTSSIFATKEEYEHAEEMYEHIDSFDRGTDLVQGVYDTQWEDFLGLYLDVTLTTDMMLAMGSAVAVTLAILVHTRSPFLTSVGLLQIVLSFPLAYFVYKIVAGLVFFPFLNFIGVFVVFALGADDVFVAVDKWKNTRLEHPNASTEYIAALALPDAADAMFLTSSTTAIAFFATAVCPVAPVKMFAIFLGLLITFDYMMCVLLVFPALCIYDNAMQEGRGPCFRYVFCCFQSVCSRKEDQPDSENDVPSQDDVDETNPSFIRRILNGYFWILQKARWGVLLASLVAFIVCVIGASKLEMPTSSDVRLLKDSNRLEQNYLWRNKLLYSSLDKIGGSTAYVIWGVKPDDTGDISKYSNVW